MFPLPRAYLLLLREVACVLGDKGPTEGGLDGYDSLRVDPHRPGLLVGALDPIPCTKFESDRSEPTEESCIADAVASLLPPDVLAGGVDVTGGNVVTRPLLTVATGGTLGVAQVARFLAAAALVGAGLAPGAREAGWKVVG